MVMRSGFRNERLLILAYHGVSLYDEHQWNPSLFVTASFLRRRFELIREYGCSVLPLGEALDRLYSHSLPEQAIAITFDDGGYNFHEKAFPLITEFDLPVTLYLTTYYSLFNKPVFPVAADYLLWEGREQVLDLDRIIGSGGAVSVSDPRLRKEVQQKIVKYADLSDLSADGKDMLLASVAEQLSIDYSKFSEERVMSLMNLSEVANISRGGVDIQLHTHRHRVPDDHDLFMREIRENTAIIESVTGIQPNHFCYPSGEYSDKFFPWLREAGIASATTCDTALTDAETDRFLIPRLVDTMQLSDVEFEGWLTGVSNFLPQRSR